MSKETIETIDDTELLEELWVVQDYLIERDGWEIGVPQMDDAPVVASRVFEVQAPGQRLPAAIISYNPDTEHWTMLTHVGPTQDNNWSAGLTVHSDPSLFDLVDTFRELVAEGKLYVPVLSSDGIREPLEAPSRKKLKTKLLRGPGAP